MNKERIKLICSDIDGTLLDRHRDLSAETIAAVKSLPHPFLLVSARMPRAMRHLQKKLNLTHLPLIAYNGGLVLAYRGEDEEPEILQSTFIPNEVTELIIQQGRDTKLHFGLFQGDEWVVSLADEWTEREIRNTKTEPNRVGITGVPDKWEKQGTGAHKIMIMGEPEWVGKLELALRSQWADQLHLYRSKPTYLELAARSISKSSAIELVARKEFGLTLDNVLAFGDNFNDVEMLRKAGHGVAVANAVEPALMVADAHTLSSKEHGVAVFLNRYYGDK